MSHEYLTEEELGALSHDDPRAYSRPSEWTLRLIADVRALRVENSSFARTIGVRTKQRDEALAELSQVKAERDEAREKYTAALAREEALKAEVLEQRDAFNAALKDPKFPMLAAEGEARLYHSLWTTADAELEAVKAELERSTRSRIMLGSKAWDVAGKAVDLETELTTARELLREAKEIIQENLPGCTVFLDQADAFLKGDSHD